MFTEICRYKKKLFLLLFVALRRPSRVYIDQPVPCPRFEDLNPNPKFQSNPAYGEYMEMQASPDTMSEIDSYSLAPTKNSSSGWSRSISMDQEKADGKPDPNWTFEAADTISHNGTLPKRVNCFKISIINQK